jgi:hypothetical protein
LEYLGDIIAFFALLLSSYSTYRTLKLKKSEKELIDVQKKLNQLILKKETKEAKEASKADLGANFITVGKHKHRLKVFNKGKANAYNVTIEFPDGNDTVIENNVEEKFPLELMERGQSVVLIAAFHTQSKSKLKVKLIWENENGKKSEKIVFPTL